MIPFAPRPSRLALALAAALPALAQAAPASDSAYMADKQNSHVEDATSKGVNQVNMITCFMTSMRPDALVNQGDYVALVDKNKCDSDSRASAENSGSSSSGSNAPNYMTATVHSSRASNDVPTAVKTWVDENEDGFSATIHVYTTATSAPTAANPYGVFHMDYCGKGPSGPCAMNGYLDGSAGGISYFETESRGMGSNTRALRLTTSGSGGGAGVMQLDEGGTPSTFSFAYNADYFRRHDGVTDQCFTRDASDPDTGMSVWSYGLYDASTGARVERQSGFPIDVTSGGVVYHGFMGYWGLSLPPGVTVNNGDTVQRVQYAPGQEPTRTDYALKKAEGRLMKYTKQTRTLASADKIRFQTFIGDATGFYGGAASNTQYEMYWDDAGGVFKVTGTVVCNSGPCQTQDLGSEQSVAASFFSTQGGARGWSQALGGEVFIPLAGVSGPVDSSAVSVIYRTQDLVYPSQMPATLHCLSECPTAATMAAYFANGSVAASPFAAGTFNNWGPTDSVNVVSYSTNASTALLTDGNSAPVVFTDGDALQSRPQYQWGVRTGRLFTDLSAAACPGMPSKYCGGMVDQMDVYYQWETGPNQWNQFAALTDGNGATVTFDAPLQVTYSVPAGAAYGAYAGKSIVLQYGGFGQLWGIPGQCVSHVTNAPVSCDQPNARYVPAFAIPFDQTLGRVMNGGTPLLVKWLDREVRFARKSLSTCTNAGVSLPSGLTLPTAADLKDPSDPSSPVYIGAKPSVTAAPRVIHGDVQY